MPTTRRPRSRSLFAGLFRPVGAIRRHKRRSAAIAFAILAAAYAVTYILVSAAPSPTDRTVFTIARDADQRIAYHIVREAKAPDTPRIILIHGAPATASSWSKLISAARALDPSLPDCEIIAVDRLGYGNASRAGPVTSLADHARSLEPLIAAPYEDAGSPRAPADASSGRPTILIGHSYGGPVALQTAAEFPHRIHGVILVAGATDPGMDDAVTLRKTLAALGPALPEPWAHANRELLALTAENRALEPRLADLACPVAFIHGEWDPVCPHDATRDSLQSALVNAADVRIISLPRSGHNLHLSHPDVILAELRRQINLINGADVHPSQLAAR